MTAPVQAEIVVKDDNGTTIRLSQPAQRIVTLAPHLVETLFAAGAGKKLVGTVTFSDYPEAAKKIPRVGSYSQIDLETIAALKPDLIIAWQSGNAPAHLNKLRALGLPIYVSQPEHILDIANEIERLGQLAGTGQTARIASRRFREWLTALQQRYSRRPVVRTFYQVWDQPLTTIGGKQMISRLIQLCGGENVFARLDALAPTINQEAVLAANPEAIVVSGMDEKRPEWLNHWLRWNSLLAVQRGNLFFIPPDLIQRHTPRLLEGAERLCQELETARSRRP